MKAEEMTTAGIAAHLDQMTKTDIFKEVPPAAQAVFVEAITRLREYSELNQRANKFYEEVLPQASKLCFQDYVNLNELGVLLSKRKL